MIFFKPETVVEIVKDGSVEQYIIGTNAGKQLF